MKEEITEQLLKENKDRFVLLPIKHADIWSMYKKHEASFWTRKKSIYTRTLRTGFTQ
jgi:hypothetical protein